ncbi:3-oxoacyl-ACP synthase III family protein [Psychroflexus planctonicus]|uniref:Beta-ketoacyl-[acyl-carrier-protein] synthase III n=1 Tax=Psychroflexus planctonicus TaxID=1526575 RepID=A0ABQ1SI60_9FLAO|nr:beta-ketoacyl-ACP synthase III [Psychroflexus planctonicus]GGE37900.1 3-oxoacyl-[acyl-carrier-protein] synthase 3 [Psychroflexus planctonicus]
MNAFISGTGMYVPEKVIPNTYFEKVGSSDEWIFNTLGIKERRVVRDEVTSDLAAKAGRNAIEDAGLQVEDIDLIIVATSTPDKQAPSSACYVQDKLKAYGAAAFDLSAVCSGAMFAVSVGCQFVENGTYQNVLVIGADTFSQIIDWSRRDSVFFGDGAGAMVISATEEDKGFIDFNLFSDGRGANHFTIENKEPDNPDSQCYFYMDGKEIYNGATDLVPKSIEALLAKNNFSIDQIDLMVPHQPSIGILKSIAKQVGLPFEKVMTNMDKYANTSGGTIPIALHEAIEQGRIENAKYILFAAVGAGMTWGTALYKVK